MTDGVDIVKKTRNLPRQRRGKAIIVLTDDYISQRDWAGKLAAQVDGQHINLLDYFEKDEELTSQVGTMTVDGLFSLLATFLDINVLVVSGIEFLRAAWSAQSGALESFIHKVETWDKEPALIFVTQFDKSLDNRKSKRYEHRFVLNQKDTYALT